MDLNKIGEFISSRRKLKKLTQEQLSEKLNISDRAVSKWERGICLPDASIMLELCQILDINVNELLSGEKIDMKDYKDKNEKLLLEIAEQEVEKNKIIWTSMWVIMLVSILALFGGIFATTFLVPEGPLQAVIIIGLCIIFLIPCFYALKLEVSVGAYKCKNCGQEIVPTYKEALWAMHMGTTRYLKCPKCKRRHWAKKVIKK